MIALFMLAPGCGDTDKPAPVWPPASCEECRGPEEPELEIGRATLRGETLPFEPFDGGELVLAVIPGGQFVLRVSIKTRGICRDYSSLTADAAPCPETGPEASCGEATRLNAFDGTEEFPAPVTLFRCPSAAPEGTPINVSVTVTERADGLCAEDPRTISEEFEVIPVCPDRDLGQAGAPELMDLHDCCELDCYEPGECFSFD